MELQLDWLVIWRQMNMVLAVIVLAMLIHRLWILRLWWTFQERAFLAGGGVMVALSLSYSIHGIRHDEDFSLGVPALTLALLLMVSSLIKNSVRHDGRLK